MTMACLGRENVRNTFFKPSGFDFSGFRFVFTDPAFSGLQSAVPSGQNAGVEGTPVASLDGPNTLLIDVSGVNLLNALFAANELDEPAVAIFAFTFAENGGPAIPLPSPLALMPAALAGFGLVARRRTGEALDQEA